MTYPLLMMTNRNIKKQDLGKDVSDMSYWRHRTGKANNLASWDRLTKAQFVKQLQDIGNSFPLLDESENESQKHIGVFVHGYNVDWTDSMARYEQLKRDLFEKAQLGALVLYSWPSNGSVAGYLPDREDARSSAPAFAQELTDMHAHLLRMQTAATKLDPSKACKAKLSIVAHSMGNYVTQKALSIAAKQLNSPQLITLVTQLVMVAADVDNDLFQRDQGTSSDGSLMANLCYRIGALYTGLDQVLGASAGLKHFGTRRLGRSGLADSSTVWDNVFAEDVSNLIDRNKSIHSAVFDSPKSLALLEKVLRGVDRKFLREQA
jgi:esterase/lipase superfamily enzyme